MRLPDGREAFCQLLFPLPLTIMPELLRAVGQAAEQAGYTNVHIMTDEGRNGWIAGTPPTTVPAVGPVNVALPAGEET